MPGCTDTRANRETAQSRPSTPPSTTAQPCPCPTTEIEINNTSAVNDDLVLMKCTQPAHRHKVPCRIRVVGSVASGRTIVLTNPDGRLRFPNDGDTTKTLTVPSNGSWVSFQISGERGSDAIGDAVIEAHCDTATGPLSSNKTVTVVWFDQEKIDVKVGGNYAVTGGSYTVTGAHAVDYEASARICPAGVDCSAPQLVNLRIGVMQNTFPPRGRVRTWTNPTISWAPGVATATAVTVPKTMHITISVGASANDSEASVAPLYDQPGQTGTLDANSLKPPTGCTGGGKATSYDTPSTPVPTLTLPAMTAAGAMVGTVTYAFQKLLHNDNFVTWCVVFNTVTKDLCALRQRGWTLALDSTAAAAQRPAVAADTAPTTAMVTALPFSNTRSNDPGNQTSGAVGADVVTFTK